MIRIITAQLLLLLLTTALLAQDRPVRSPLMEMVDSERAFSRTSVETGIRASFMSWFDDSAMVFRPHPVYYKEAMKNVPPPTNPHETSLVWEPIIADIAQSGDFGYTSGPSVWTDLSAAKRPPYYGFYFSIWKKHPVRGWKVAFDVGTEMPGPYTGSRTFRVPEPLRRSAEIPMLIEGEQHLDLMNTEKKFLETDLKSGSDPALEEFMDDGARVYREKEHPLVGRKAIRSYFASKPYLSSWETISGDVASSGDLGYVYGRYALRAAAGSDGTGERGYYLRVWRRDAHHRWKFVAEVVSAFRQEAPLKK